MKWVIVCEVVIIFLAWTYQWQAAKIEARRRREQVRVYDEFGYEVLSHNEGIMSEILNDCGM